MIVYWNVWLNIKRLWYDKFSATILCQKMHLLLIHLIIRCEIFAWIGDKVFKILDLRFSFFLVTNSFKNLFKRFSFNKLMFPTLFFRHLSNQQFERHQYHQTTHFLHSILKKRHLPILRRKSIFWMLTIFWLHKNHKKTGVVMSLQNRCHR